MKILSENSLRWKPRLRFTYGSRLTVFLLLASVLLKYFPMPWVGIGVLLLAGIGWEISEAKKSNQQAAWINIGAVILSITLFETYLWIQHDATTTVMSPGLYTKNNTLGYALKKNSIVRATKYIGEEQVFKVLYTINTYGLRENPRLTREAAPTSCVVFFGGSFTFGEGVNDHQTLPAQIEIQSYGKYETFNFGVGGYGPHQVLALLESHLEKPSLNCQPQYGIYQGIPNHIVRVAGRALWDKHGPKYEISPSGQIVRKGTFTEETRKNSSGWNVSHIWEALFNQLEKSTIVRNFLDAQALKISQKDIDLYVGVVATAAQIFEHRYSHATFQVIYWDIHDRKTSQMVIEKLRAVGTRVLPISQILKEEQLIYKIHPKGVHPHPQVYEMMAQYLLTNTLQ